MAIFTLSKINSKKVFDLLKRNNQKFLQDVKRRWVMDAQDIIALINRARLTTGGNNSLKRRSGQASRVIMSRTTITKLTQTVVNKFFLDKNNPASVYLPVHDKSYKGSRIIRPKRGKWLKFKTADGNWVTTNRVFIPPRTDIMQILTKRAKKKFVASVNDSLKVFANG